MGVRAHLSEDKKTLIIEADMPEEGETLEKSGSGNTMKVAGFGAPLQTGVKYEYEGKKYDVTAQVNVWIPNPEVLAEREKAKADKKKAAKGGAAAPAAAAAAAPAGGKKK